jgi:hypothetical protein
VTVQEKGGKPFLRKLESIHQFLVSYDVIRVYRKLDIPHQSGQSGDNSKDIPSVSSLKRYFETKMKYTEEGT